MLESGWVAKDWKTMETILDLVAQIVAAHVSNTAVAPDQLPKLISNVHHALATAGQTGAQPAMPAPAVSVKRSISPDKLLCLDCGRSFSTLKRHLASDHQLTPGQYRDKWGLPATYPMVAPNYTKTRSRLAKKIGLGRV
jgi:predicted transcriptional regulator